MLLRGLVFLGLLAQACGAIEIREQVEGDFVSILVVLPEGFDAEKMAEVVRPFETTYSAARVRHYVFAMDLGVASLEAPNWHRTRGVWEKAREEWGAKVWAGKRVGEWLSWRGRSGLRILGGDGVVETRVMTAESPFVLEVEGRTLRLVHVAPWLFHGADGVTGVDFPRMYFVADGEPVSKAVLEQALAREVRVSRANLFVSDRIVFGVGPYYPTVAPFERVVGERGGAARTFANCEVRVGKVACR